MAGPGAAPSAASVLRLPRRGDVNLIADEIAGWFPGSSTTGDIYDSIQHGADAELAKVVRDAIHDFPF